MQNQALLAGTAKDIVSCIPGSERYEFSNPAAT
jgi:hypothetical protein